MSRSSYSRMPSYRNARIVSEITMSGCANWYKHTHKKTGKKQGKKREKEKRKERDACQLPGSTKACGEGYGVSGPGIA
eukprot:570138-Rhodomonas_salina.3